MRLRAIPWIIGLGVALSGCASAGNGLRPSPFPMPAAPPAIYPEPLAPSVRSFSTAAFVTAARQLSGVRYQLGGESPVTGFDCSGYVQYVFRLFRVTVPRTVAEQYRAGRPAKSQAIRAGDLLFFRTSGSSVSHVALAIGPDEFIHAPAESGVVRTEKLSSPYWHARFVGARRIL
jgi:cell wall-associated NlpC family hydrolase